jgi:hypothetical protein
MEVVAGIGEASEAADSAGPDAELGYLAGRGRNFGR